MITQRPAVINKNVLSQVDGLIAMKLTSSQDRDAIGAWIEGQADRHQGKEILASLPALQRGQGVIWLPGRCVLKIAPFPENQTFDSSRTPKRGERKHHTELKPLDLAALKERLAIVEAETKANDPKVLKAEIATLKRQITEAAEKAAKSDEVPDPKAIEAAEQRGYEGGLSEGSRVGFRDGYNAGLEAAAEHFKAAAAAIDKLSQDKPPSQGKAVVGSASGPAPKAALRIRQVSSPKERLATNPSNASITGPQVQMLRALAWWSHMGNDAPTRAQVAAIAGWRITSGHLRNVAGSLSSAGLIRYPEQGRLALTPEGAVVAPEPDIASTVIEGIRGTLNSPQQQMFDCLLKARKPLAREEIAERLGWAPTSGHLRNVAGSLSTLEIVEYPAPGVISLRNWVMT